MGTGGYLLKHRRCAGPIFKPVIQRAGNREAASAAAKATNNRAVGAGRKAAESQII